MLKLISEVLEMEQVLKNNILRLKGIYNKSLDKRIIREIGYLYFENGYYEDASIYLENYIDSGNFNNKVVGRLFICYLYMGDNINFINLWNKHGNRVDNLSCIDKIALCDALLFTIRNKNNAIVDIAISLLKRMEDDKYFKLFLQRCVFESERALNYDMAIYFAEMLSKDIPDFLDYVVFFKRVIEVNDNIPYKEEIFREVFDKNRDAIEVLKEYNFSLNEALDVLVVLVKYMRLYDNNKANYMFYLYINLNKKINEQGRVLKK